MNRRILILGEGATELRAPGDRWTGCGRVLLRRLLGEPPQDLLSFDEHVLGTFPRDPALTQNEPPGRDDGDRARLGRKLASRDAHALVLMRDDDRRERRLAIGRGFEQARAQGHVVPAVLALAIECIEAWALADPDAWKHVFGKVPSLPRDPEALWGSARDAASSHPKHVLSRCLAEIDRRPDGNAVAQLLEHASLEAIAMRCPRGFGRFVADLRRALPPIACVVAASADHAIGLEGDAPWGFAALRDHVTRVHRLASGAGGDRVAVIMGRKAWQALPALPPSSHRLDIVVTRSEISERRAHVRTAAGLDDALTAAANDGASRVYVLGGGELYREALGHFRCVDIHVTRVEAEFPGADTFFPDITADGAWCCRQGATQHHDNGFDYRIEHWSRFTR